MKNKITIIIIFILIVLAISISLYLKQDKNETSSNPFPIEVFSDKLLVESKEDYNSVEVYQQNNKLIINAKSDAAFFEGVQFTVDTKETINKQDVEIIWTTVGGGTEKTEHNDRIIAEIKIKEDGIIIFDEKVNFLKKANEILNEYLEKQINSNK